MSDLLRDVVSKNDFIQVKAYKDRNEDLKESELEYSLKYTIQKIGNLEIASYLLDQLNLVRGSKISFEEIYRMFNPISTAIALHLFIEQNRDQIMGFNSDDILHFEVSSRIKIYLQKGDYKQAVTLAKIYFELDLDPVNELTEAIILGLKNSYENNNKYQAMLQLINKAGIEIPQEFQYLLTSREDHHRLEEFDFLSGMLHKLASYYINLGKSNLNKSLQQENCKDQKDISQKIDQAFNSYDFEELKNLCNASSKLVKINDKFSGYFEVFGNALNLLDNDFTLEILTINGLKQELVQDEMRVFRGIQIYNLMPDDIDSYFKYGHRSYSTIKQTNTRITIGDQLSLGFNIKQPWNTPDKNSLYNYGATYNTMDFETARVFSKGPAKFLFEFKLHKNYSPKICNNEGVGGFGNTDEYEILTSTISGEDIVAIYMKDSNGNSIIYKNPYIADEITPMIKINETSNSVYIEDNQLQKDLYNNVVCKDIVERTKESIDLYKSYEDFIDKYSEDDYITDQNDLYQEYFVDRPVYEEGFFYGIVEQIDLSYQCTLMF